MPSDSVLVMLRCSRDELARLDDLFGFSIERALWALESAPSAAARLTITRCFIAPLERERHRLHRAALRCAGDARRLLLPAATVELIERQWRSLCRVASRADFDPAVVPAAIGDPWDGWNAFQRALGRRPAPPSASHRRSASAPARHPVSPRS